MTQPRKIDETIDAIERIVDETITCEECDHPVHLHDSKEGCTFERGDHYESGYAPMALGPCGCQAYTVEDAGPDSQGDEGVRQADYFSHLRERA